MERSSWKRSLGETVEATPERSGTLIETACQRRRQDVSKHLLVPDFTSSHVVVGSADIEDLTQQFVLDANVSAADCPNVLRSGFMTGRFPKLAAPQPYEACYNMMSRTLSAEHVLHRIKEGREGASPQSLLLGDMDGSPIALSIPWGGA